MLMLGYAVAIYNVVRWAKRTGRDHQSVIDAGLASIIGGVVGGRLLHVLADGYFWDYVHLCTDPAKVAWQITPGAVQVRRGLWDAAALVCRPAERDCLAWAKFYNGGLAYYGGLVVGTRARPPCLARDGLPLLKVDGRHGHGRGDGPVFRPHRLLPGRLLLRLGHRASALGVSFPAWSPASEGQFREGLLAHPSMASLPVHATQLYEAFGCLLLSVFLSRWGPRHQRFDGQITLLFLLGYAVLRFVLEFLRADDRGLYGVSARRSG